MVKKILFGGLLLLIFLSILNPHVNAKKDDPSELASNDLPEKNGIYPVKGRPDLKLRVFVHPARNNRGGRPRPSPSPTPVLKCSIDDPDSGAVDSISSLHLPSAFYYNLNPSSVPTSVGSQNLKTIAANGFKSWVSAINNQIITITKATDTTQNRVQFDGQNIIFWGKAQPGVLGVAYIWYYVSSGEIAEVDTILNNIYPWSWSNPAYWNEPTTCAYPGSYDAQDILTHELGHWMGVADEYDLAFENNTMYGYGYMEETKKDTLTTGDITAVNNVYH